jgi:hypothetical protein
VSEPESKVNVKGEGKSESLTKEEVAAKERNPDED